MKGKNKKTQKNHKTKKQNKKRCSDPSNKTTNQTEKHLLRPSPRAHDCRTAARSSQRGSRSAALSLPRRWQEGAGAEGLRFLPCLPSGPSPRQCGAQWAVWRWWRVATGLSGRVASGLDLGCQWRDCWAGLAGAGRGTAFHPGASAMPVTPCLALRAPATPPAAQPAQPAPCPAYPRRSLQPLDAIGPAAQGADPNAKG